MIEVPAHEKDRVRVFAVNGGSDVGGLRQTFLSQLEGETPLPKPETLAALLGTDAVDPAYVEIFPVGDIAELGLSRYLTDALDVRQEALAPDRGKLDALDGSVMIVLSKAFGGHAVSFTPGAALTLIGVYPTQTAAQPAAVPLPDPGGAGMPAPDTDSAKATRPLGSGLIALIVFAGLLIAAVLVLSIAGGGSQ